MLLFKAPNKNLMTQKLSKIDSTFVFLIELITSAMTI